MTGTEIKGLKKSLEHGVKYLWEGYGVVIYGTQPHKDGFLRYTLDLYAPDGHLMLDHGIKSAWQVRQIIEGKKTVITEGGSKRKETASGTDTSKILKLEISSPVELTEKVINTLVSDSKRMEVYLTKVSEVAPTLLDTYHNVICECVDTVSKHMYEVFCNNANDRKAKALAYIREKEAKETAAIREKRNADLAHRLQTLLNYIKQYDAKVGAAFIAGNAEKAQMLAIQKEARIARANEIINSINILIEE